MPAVLSTRPGEAAGPAEIAATPLWRNWQFQTLWLGSTASSLGESVADVAYPLVILALTGSPAKAGLFAAVLTAGTVIGALPAGQLADRRDRRAIVIAAESGRAAVTAAVAVGLMVGWLSLPLLLAAAVLLGIGHAVTAAARLPLVRAVVSDSQLTSALMQDEVRQNGAALAGPPLAGWLDAVRLLSHAIPLVCTAVAFAFSMLAAVTMKVMPRGVPGLAGTAHQTAGASGTASETNSADSNAPALGARRSESDMLAGIRALWQAPLLRAAMLLIMIVNMTGVGLDLAVIVILRHQHVQSGTIGLALGAGAVGGLAGAPLVKVLHRLRPGVLLMGMGLICIPVFALLALPLGPWWVAGLLFIAMLGVPALRVLIDVLVFRQTPDEQRGRIVAAVMMLIAIGMPAGMAGTGLLLQWLPAQTAMLILVAVLTLGVAYCATKPEVWRARWPR